MFNTPKLKPIVTELLSQPEVAAATIGWNLMHDERISSERAERAEMDFATLIGSADAQAVIGHLYNEAEKRACLRAADFLNPSLSSANFHDGKGIPPALHDTVPLVRVANLGGLIGRLKRALRSISVTGNPLADLLSAAGTPGGPPLDPVTLLDRKLADFWEFKMPDGSTRAGPGIFSPGNLTEHQRRLRGHSFLGQLFSLLNEVRVASPFEPMWATRWLEFSAHDWHSPHRWSEIVGVSSSRPVNWWLLLRYPAGRADLMVRPTQLDGGWYEWHFPTPAGAATGFTMERDGSRPAYPLSVEYVHEHIPLEPADAWACARVDRTIAPLPVAGSSHAPQDRHLPLLQREVPTPTPWVRHPHP